MPRIPRGRRLTADSAAHGGGARRARRARFARACDQLVGRRCGGGRRGHAGHRACRCRRGRAESRLGDSLRAGAAGVANAPPAGELAGQRDEVLAAYPEPFWRAEGLSGEGFAPHQFVRELYDNSPPSASVGVLCTSLPGEQAEFAGRLTLAHAASSSSREWRSSSAMQLYSRRTTSRPTGRRRSGRAGVRLDVRHRWPHAVRRGHAPPVGPIHWACSDISGFGHMHMEGAVRSGEAAATDVLAL